MTMGLATRRARVGRTALPCRFFLALSLATLAATAARAADEDNQLQMVVVTATRLPTPALEVASSITVVTAADIDSRQERTFADVLKDVPGLNVVQTGGPGGVTSCERGSGGTR